MSSLMGTIRPLCSIFTSPTIDLWSEAIPVNGQRLHTLLPALHDLNPTCLSLLLNPILLGTGGSVDLINLSPKFWPLLRQAIGGAGNALSSLLSLSIITCQFFLRIGGRNGSFGLNVMLYLTLSLLLLVSLCTLLSASFLSKSRAYSMAELIWLGLYPLESRSSLSSVSLIFRSSGILTILTTSVGTNIRIIRIFE